MMEDKKTTMTPMEQMPSPLPHPPTCKRTKHVNNYLQRLQGNNPSTETQEKSKPTPKNKEKKRNENT